jgi:hypothetical protein
LGSFARLAEAKAKANTDLTDATDRTDKSKGSYLRLAYGLRKNAVENDRWQGPLRVVANREIVKPAVASNSLLQGM